MSTPIKILYVSDHFYPEFTGGAELTSAAIMGAAPKSFEISNIKASYVTRNTINQYKNHFWIFGNFTHLNFSFLPEIISKIKYAVIEYDFKFCVYQSPEKHKAQEYIKCDCENTFGQRIGEFYRKANMLFFMSNRQQEEYHKRFPYLKDGRQEVLSSVFDVESINYIRSLRNRKPGILNNLMPSKRYLILKSDSWIKGYRESVEYCKNNGIPFEAVSKLAYKDLLKKLADSKGLVFMPLGGDSCPRLVIEGKLLGKDLILNDNVLHKDEEWFNGSIKQAEEYLLTRPMVFWKKIMESIDV